MKSVIGLAHVLLWCLGAVALFTACSTERAASGPRTMPGEVARAQLDPGVIVITSCPQMAAISSDPPNARLESAGEGAENAARSVLNTPHLGHAQLEAAVGVFESAAAPFAAAYGAISASQQRMPADKLCEAENALVEAMRSNAGSESLRDKVADTARQKTGRLLICAPGISAAPASSVPVSAGLEVAVEQLRLKVAKPGKSDYLLYIEARARLLRASDGAVLLDKSYRYTSGPAMYVDWTRHGGLAGVAQTGYQSLAEQIAGDVFQPASEPPLLIGPGQKHSSLRITGGLARRSMTDLWLASSDRVLRPSTLLPERPSADAPGFRLVSSVEAPATSLEVYTPKTDQHLQVQTPGSGVEDNAASQSNAEWALDGLENDRNAVVQFVSCLAAVPLGIWEQTVGAVRLHSRDKTEKLVQGLDAISDQKHFAGELADEVARRLRSQVINDIRRTEEPIRFALATPAETRATEPVGRRASNDSQLALQIHVVKASLVGKYQSSRSRALCMQLQATIIRASDGQELYSRPIVYRSSSKPLKDWAASDAHLFRQELDACSRQAAEALTRELIKRGFVTPGLGSRVPNSL
jgi:hypothetical protein